MQENNYKGFSLFNEVEEKELRNYNRARILVNIMEDHLTDGKVSHKGAALAFGYFAHIPDAEKKDVMDRVQILFAERGIQVE